MSKELLAKAAFFALQKDEEGAKDSFEEFCDSEGWEYGASESDLNEFAVSCTLYLSGEDSLDTLKGMARELGYSIKMKSTELPNEDKTMEEERAESYNESAQQ